MKTRSGNTVRLVSLPGTGQRPRTAAEFIRRLSGHHGSRSREGRRIGADAARAVEGMYALCVRDLRPRPQTGTVKRSASPQQIAATLCALLGVNPPSGSTAGPLVEALQ